MTFGLYSIRDVRTGFMTPAMEANDDAAKRNFAHAVSNSDGILSSFSADFTLYRIADFDADTGIVTPITPIAFVISGSEASYMQASYMSLRSELDA
ncbi:nonstructural protein [Sigmofec virus UA08Rod_5539]|uniref:Nonstructural protein n=1 Tax=Sigmofec virus UA08Rod_5539 TaxID=2929428 RepID=A0A976R6Y5_9VIRU|nr:nonstructural protein [Sigmofec virus UA08Rod_5539]